MDGRTHPTNLDPTFYGHSIGWWEGDTLVVDTIGYNEGFWMDRRGSPTTEKLHTLEKFTRTNAATIHYETLVDDPGAYTKPWSSAFDLRWENGTELFEYVCQQMNYAPTLMVGAGEVRRSHDADRSLTTKITKITKTTRRTLFAKESLRGLRVSSCLRD